MGDTIMLRRVRSCANRRKKPLIKDGIMKDVLYLSYRTPNCPVSHGYEPYALIKVCQMDRLRDGENTRPSSKVIPGRRMPWEN